MSTEGMLNGRYRAKAKKWALGDGKNAPQLVIDFELLEGPKTGQSVSYFGSFAEAATKFTIEAARNCGWVGSDFEDFDNPRAGLDRNEVSLVIEPDTYEGVTREKVKWVNALGGAAAVKPLAADKRAAFKQSFKAALLQHEAGQPKATPTPPKTNGQPAPAGDVPF
jgi:hypothetical protein